MGSNIKNKVIRYSSRAIYDKDSLLELLNRNFVCNVGFIDDGVPYIIPMTYVNDENFIYLHGSPEGRLINILKDGSLVTISVMELNGIVLAKKIRYNSINYSSALIFGKGEEISDINSKLAVFKAFVNRVLLGRWENSIIPSEDDLRNVSVLKINIISYSMKRRDGGPYKDKNDDMKIWDGVIPFVHKYEMPEGNEENLPAYIKDKILSSRK